MRLGFDVSRISDNSQTRTGVEWYTYYLLKNLMDIDYRNQYFLYTYHDYPADLPSLPANFKWEKTWWPPKFGWGVAGLPWTLVGQKLDAFLMPAYVLPWYKNCPQIITWHDFAYEEWPESYYPKQLDTLRHGWQRVLKQADGILVPSEAVKNYALEHYPQVSTRIAVTPLGVDQEIFFQRSDLEVEEYKRNNGIIKPYVLFVGRLERKKNIKNLLESFFEFNKKMESRYQIVLAGRPGFGFDELESLIEEHKSEVVIIEKFNRDDLARLYSGALVLFFATLAEGFGLPVLEALACNCSVIASDLPIMHEVGGQAINYTNPDSLEAMTVSLEKIVNGSKVLFHETEYQLNLFSWERTAKLTLEQLQRFG